MSDKLHEFYGKRVLVVEDEYLTADDLRRQLIAHGAEVVGPVASVNEALALIESRAIDAAVLDINLHAEIAFPVAFVLDERKLPFVFATAAVPEDLPEHYFKYVLG
jgi:DNA-binding response OmpR family regulator